MITAERLAALTAIRNGTVQYVHHAGRGEFRRAVEPREHTVAVGFLNRAGLTQPPHGNGLIMLSPRGERLLHALA